MPFITLDNNWSRLAEYYNSVTNNGNFASTANYPNVVGSPKPTIPRNIEQFSISDDGFIRGGAQNALLATTKDLLRVTKFLANPDGGQAIGDTRYERFVENTKGALFFIRQLGLQRTNPRLEINKRNVLSGLASSLGGPTRIFTGVGSLASVGGSAFGLHFDRGGILGVIPANQKYGGDANNPQVGVVYSNNFSQLSLSSNQSITTQSRNRLLEYTAKIFEEKTDNTVVLDNYLGGPNSLYGIVGRTRTISYFDRTTVRTNDLPREVSLKSSPESQPITIPSPGRLGVQLNGFTPSTSEDISKTTPTLKPGDTSVSFPAPKELKYKAYNPPGYTLESRYGVSTPSGPGSSNHKLDAINSIYVVGSDVFYGTSANNETDRANSYVDINKVQGNYGEDLIKFVIEFLNNNSPSSPQPINTDVLAFRAYIDSFDDGMNAKWSSYRYMGRGEEFYVYEGFTRDIGVSFTMHAHNEEEMAPLYSKLNYLMSAMTPDYNDQLKMRGNIGYLTVGDYLYRQPGIFTDVKLSGMLEGSWDTGLNRDGSPNDQYQVPRMIRVGLSFKPIHSFLPRRNYSSKEASANVQNFPAPFITRDTKAYPTKVNKVDVTTNNYLNVGDWKQ